MLVVLISSTVGVMLHALASLLRAHAPINKGESVALFIGAKRILSFPTAAAEGQSAAYAIYANKRKHVRQRLYKLHSSNGG